MPSMIVQRGLHPTANHSKYLYFFRRSGDLFRMQKGKNARGEPYKAVKLKIKMRSKWRDGYFYSLNGAGDVVETKMAKQFR